MAQSATDRRAMVGAEVTPGAADTIYRRKHMVGIPGIEFVYAFAGGSPPPPAGPAPLYPNRISIHLGIGL